MNERHEGQLKKAHQLYDNRDLKQELLWQREFLDTGYLSYQQVCFNKWIFDECLKRLEERKVGKWIGTCRIGFGEFAECEVELIDGFVADNCHCSECGEELEKGERGIYCPNCGADMRGSEK